MGDVSSIRRPTFDTIRSRICIRWALSRKGDVGLFDAAIFFDEDVVRPVDHDVGHAFFLEKDFEWAEAEGFVKNFFDEPFAFGTVQQRVFGVAQVFDDESDFAAQRFAFEIPQSRQVELVDEFPVNQSFEFLEVRLRVPPVETARLAC